EGPAHGGEYVVLARRYREKQEHAALGTPVKGLFHRSPLPQVGPQGYRADGRFPARRDHHQTPPVAADQFHPLRRLPQDTDGHGLLLAVEPTHPGLPKAQYVRSRLDAGGLEVPGLVSCSPSGAAWSSSQEWGATFRRAAASTSTGMSSPARSTMAATMSSASLKEASASRSSPTPGVDRNAALSARRARYRSLRRSAYCFRRCARLLSRIIPRSPTRGPILVSRPAERTAHSSSGRKSFRSSRSGLWLVMTAWPRSPAWRRASRSTPAAAGCSVLSGSSIPMVLSVCHPGSRCFLPTESLWSARVKDARVVARSHPVTLRSWEAVAIRHRTNGAHG